jgi:hypothetical protein
LQPKHVIENESASFRAKDEDEMLLTNLETISPQKELEREK